MEELESIDRFFEEVDNLARYDFDDPAWSAPRRTKVYTRDATNPFDFFTDQEFKCRYRFDKSTVLKVILPLVAEDLQRFDNRGLPISPEKQLLIALRFYSTGCFQVVAADCQDVTQPTVCNIVTRVSKALANKWPQFIRFPNDLEKIKLDFELRGQIGDIPGLPNIIGAIGCTHVTITRPRGIEHSEAFCNSYNKFSLNVQVVVGPDMKFYDVVARWPGSTHDSRIYKNSRLHIRLTQNEINGTLVGNSSLVCTQHILTPLLNPQTQPQQRYNSAQIKTHNIVERAFGVLKSRFSCLKVGLRNKLTTSSNIIVACTVLHNIAVMYGDQYSVDDVDPLPTNPRPVFDNNADGLAFRSTLIESRYRLSYSES